MHPDSSRSIPTELNFKTENPLKSNIPPANVQTIAATSNKYRFGIPGLKACRKEFNVSIYLILNCKGTLFFGEVKLIAENLSIESIISVPVCANSPVLCRSYFFATFAQNYIYDI